jgi:hypothetical protein
MKPISIVNRITREEMHESSYLLFVAHASMAAADLSAWLFLLGIFAFRSKKQVRLQLKTADPNPVHPEFMYKFNPDQEGENFTISRSIPRDVKQSLELNGISELNQLFGLEEGHPSIWQV